MKDDYLFCNFLKDNLHLSEQVVRRHLSELRRIYYPHIDHLNETEIEGCCAKVSAINELVFL